MVMSADRPARGATLTHLGLDLAGGDGGVGVLICDLAGGDGGEGGVGCKSCARQESRRQSYHDKRSRERLPKTE
jgi:hypothetical protein